MKRLVHYSLKKLGYRLRKIEPAKIHTGLWASLGKDEIRRLFHYEQILATKHLEGDIAECGVAAGGTLAFVAALQQEISDRRHIWAFDSYEGFPAGSDKDAKWFNESGRPGFQKYTLEFVKNYLRKASVPEETIAKINFIKGWIPESFSGFPEGTKVSLVVSARFIPPGLTIDQIL